MFALVGSEPAAPTNVVLETLGSGSLLSFGFPEHVAKRLHEAHVQVDPGNDGAREDTRNVCGSRPEHQRPEQDIRVRICGIERGEGVVSMTIVPGKIAWKAKIVLQREAAHWQFDDQRVDT